MGCCCVGLQCVIVGDVCRVGCAGFCKVSQLARGFCKELGEVEWDHFGEVLVVVPVAHTNQVGLISEVDRIGCVCWHGSDAMDDLELALDAAQQECGPCTRLVTFVTL